MSNIRRTSIINLEFLIALGEKNKMKFSLFSGRKTKTQYYVFPIENIANKMEKDFSKKLKF